MIICYFITENECLPTQQQQQQQQNDEKFQGRCFNKICPVKFETIFFKEYLLKHVKNFLRCNLTKL